MSLKSFLVSKLEGTDLLLWRVLTRHSFLHELGWIRSWRNKRPVDKAGNPLPWITYAAMSFLDKRLNSRMSVFEYGCGGSTYWFAARARQVISCEHDESWAVEVRGRASANVEIIHAPLAQGRYAGVVGGYSDCFDIVFVDGRDRVACVRNCLPALNSGGVVVIDNSDETEHLPAIDFLKAQGFKHLPFDGPGPGGTRCWETSILYRPDNCLGL